MSVSVLLFMISSILLMMVFNIVFVVIFGNKNMSWRRAIVEIGLAYFFFFGLIFIVGVIDYHITETPYIKY